MMIAVKTMKNFARHTAATEDAEKTTNTTPCANAMKNAMIMRIVVQTTVLYVQLELPLHQHLPPLAHHLTTELAVQVSVVLSTTIQKLASATTNVPNMVTVAMIM